MSTNPHTGDKLISKVNTKEFDDNYDRIFGNPRKTASVSIVDDVEGEKVKYNFKETTDD